MSAASISLIGSLIWVKFCLISTGSSPLPQACDVMKSRHKDQWGIGQFLRYSAASGSFQISACNQLRHHRSGSTYPAGQRTDNVLRYFSARSPASKWFLLVPRTEEKHSKNVLFRLFHDENWNHGIEVNFRGQIYTQPAFFPFKI